MFSARGLGGAIQRTGDIYSDPGMVPGFDVSRVPVPATTQPTVRLNDIVPVDMGFQAGFKVPDLIPGTFSELVGGNTKASYGNTFGAALGGTGFGSGASYNAGPGGMADSMDGRLSFRGINFGGGAIGQAAHEHTDDFANADMANLGGDWSKVDQWNAAIQRAQQQTYQKTGVMVPGNVIKAIMKIESGGEHLPANYAGYVGLMQVGPGSWGVGSDWDLGQATADPEYNIFAGTMELARRYNDAKSKNPAYTWSNVAVGYFSGHYEPDGSSDAWNSDYNYQKMFDQNLAMLGGLGGGGYSLPGNIRTGAGQATGDVFSLIDGSSFSSWGEFNAPSSNGYYTYGTSYGLNGVNHTGLDIAGPVGGAQYAPMGGTVVCAATGVGPGADGMGCGAFNYVPNFGGAPQRQGAGRIEILLDNGVSLIYGHSLDTYVKPGQRVNAGDVIGTLGGMNSAHVHLEARIRDPSTESGWRIVDPRQYVGGSGFTPGVAPGMQNQGATAEQFGQTLGRVTMHRGPAMGIAFSQNSPYSQNIGRVSW